MILRLRRKIITPLTQPTSSLRAERSGAWQSVDGCAALSDTTYLSDTDCFGRRASSLAMTVLAGCAPFIIQQSSFIHQKPNPSEGIRAGAAKKLT